MDTPAAPRGSLSSNGERKVRLVTKRKDTLYSKDYLINVRMKSSQTTGFQKVFIIYYACVRAHTHTDIHTCMHECVNAYTLTKILF